MLSANIFRGALGHLLPGNVDLFGRGLLSEDATQFLPRPALVPATGKSPSGLADPPRPFVFRTRHLDGRCLEPGERFHVDLHLFTLKNRIAEYLQEAFSRFETSGFGPARSRAVLEQVDGPSSVVLSLAPLAGSIPQTRVDFLSPTELKHNGSLIEEPAFPVLVGRACSRLATLQALYGEERLHIDFSALQEHASQITVNNYQLRHCQKWRRSSRTGQVHPLGGFVGFAEYEGDLDSLIPYLQASHWTGLGRQTVWGKGEILVQSPRPAQATSRG